MTGLPDSLKTAIARATEGFSRNEIARRAEQISKSYRSGGTSKTIDGPLDVAAYLVARLPATYAAVFAVLSEVSARAPGFMPKDSLDIGAGPGTASWAAAEIWPALENVRLLDSNAALLDMARQLAADSVHPALAQPQILSRDLNAVSLASADLVIASYSLAEIPAARLDETVSSLWDACTGILAIVEPGTPEGFERIRTLRAALVKKGARIVAPCPHALACPIVAPDWCHFSQRLPRSRDHMIVKSADVPFEDEKFSYLAVARDSVEIQPYAARVLAPPVRNKAALTLKLCADGDIRQAVIASRDRANFAALRRTEWGDALGTGFGTGTPP